MNFFKKKEPELDFNSNLGLDTKTDFGEGNDFNKNTPGMHEQDNFISGTDFNQENQFAQGMQHEQLQPSVNLSNNQFQPVQQNNSGADLQKDIQILSLKLDAIKSELDSMSQRVKNIEAIAEKEQKPKKWY